MQKRSTDQGDNLVWHVIMLTSDRIGCIIIRKTVKIFLKLTSCHKHKSNYVLVLRAKLTFWYAIKHKVGNRKPKERKTKKMNNSWMLTKKTMKYHLSLNCWLGVIWNIIMSKG